MIFKGVSMSPNFCQGENGLIARVLQVFKSEVHSESHLEAQSEAPVRAATPQCHKSSLRKLRATDETLRRPAFFWQRMRSALLAKTAKEFGKVESVTITPLTDVATTGSGAPVSAANRERSLGRARVTSTRLSALKTYLEEPA